MTMGWGHSRAILLLAGLVAGCALTAEPETVAPPAAVVDEAPAEEDGWKEISSTEDHDRLARLDTAWTAALSEARDKGFAEEIENEGALLEPDVALPRAAPPPGSEEHTSELQSLMRNSYAVFCLKN